jgi:RecJ-like exonuclease
MVADFVLLFENCVSCHGRGHWLVSGTKKDGQKSKRRVRYPCPKCRGTGRRKAADQLDELTKIAEDAEARKTDGIPF